MATAANSTEEPFRILLAAYYDAQILKRDVWDFAVEIRFLERAGMSYSLLRFSAGLGEVLLAREVFSRGSQKRSFEPTGNFLITRHTCVVLTEKGAAVALAAVRQAKQFARARRNGSLKNGRATRLRPSWDSAVRELRLGSRFLKRFTKLAVNQELILAAFEEEGWPPRIDDPLPPKPGADPKQRLRETITNLNRSRISPFLCFRGDGTGTGICWQRRPQIYSNQQQSYSGANRSKR
jgi:hypothetical protein